MLDPTTTCNLPDVAIFNILKLVPLQQRLGPCALVCKSWAAAAARATTYIIIMELKCQQKTRLTAWLQQHDQWRHLERLQLAPYGPDYTWDEFIDEGRTAGGPLTLQLPLLQLGHLKTLKVAGFDLELVLPPGGPPPASTEAGPFDLSNLASALTADNTAAVQQAAAAMVPSLMPELRELKLSCYCHTPQLLSHITGVTGMQLWPAFNDGEFIYGTEDMSSQSVEQRMYNDQPGKAALSIAEACGALLHNNPGLKCLNLGCQGIGRADDSSSRRQLEELVLQQLSRLTNLDTLVIHPLVYNPGALASLPTSLTLLHLSGQPTPFRDLTHPLLDSTETPQLCKLSSLQKLTLCLVPFDPAILTDKARLTELRIHECAVYKRGSPESATDQEIEEHLLTNLSQVTRLQTLVIGNIWTRSSRSWDTNIRSWDTNIPPQRFAPLLASKELTRLQFTVNHKRPWPPGTLQHMLPPGKLNSRLQVIKLTANKHWVSGVKSEYADDDDDEEIQHEDKLWCVDAADISSITRGCPALNELGLNCVVHGGTDVSCLLPLHAQLNVLDVGGVAFDDAASWVVAQLTNLGSLSWWQSPGLTDAGLFQLTSLRRLSSFNLQNCPGVSQGMRNKGKLLQSLGLNHGHFAGWPAKYWHLKSPQESYPDVWLQLWALLGESSTMAAQLDYNPAVKHTSSLAAIVLRVVEEVIDRDLDRHSSGYGHSSIYTARADLDSAALAAALSGSDVQQLRRAVAGAILQRLDLRPFSQVRDDIAPDDDWSECMLHCEHVSGEACGVCLMAV